MEENTTSEINYDYEGINIDNFPNNVCLLNDKNELAIQDVNYFNGAAYKKTSRFEKSFLCLLTFKN